MHICNLSNTNYSNMMQYEPKAVIDSMQHELMNYSLSLYMPLYIILLKIMHFDMMLSIIKVIKSQVT